MLKINNDMKSIKNAENKKNNGKIQNEISLEEIENIFTNRDVGGVGEYRFFSVLVPLVEKDGQLHVLFEVRSIDLVRQPGEVCFPGGKVEKGESPRRCAIRETKEELGIEEENIRIICQLNSLHNYSNFTMYSFLGVIDYNVLKNSKIYEGEVKEKFLVPLSFFMETEPYIHKITVTPLGLDDFPYEMLRLTPDYYWRKGKIELPIYQYKGYDIWGLTGRIIRDFVKIIQGKKE